MKIRSLLITLTLLIAITASAQEVIVIGGAKYSIHNVERGETLYSLARTYGVTVDDIIGANEVLVNGLKAGQRIKIPIIQPASPKREVKEVRNAKVEATPLPAPTPTVEEVAEVTPTEVTPLRTLTRDESAEVALLLPLGSEESPSQNYLDFYRGFLMGLERVRLDGYSVNLSLYNTAHDYNRVEEIISSGALEKANLVVGPVYEDELIPVASALQERGTPIVSPLANLRQISGSNIFQMSPAPKTKLNKVRSMFDGSKRVVIISTDNIDNEFDAEVRSMLRDTSYVVEHKYVYEHPSIIEKREREREKLREKLREEGVADSLMMIDDTPSPSDMSPLLRGNEPTVVVITANNEVEVDRILAGIASANIALKARSQSVVPFVIYGNNRWNRYRNIDRAILFSNNVTMLSTYHARRSEASIKEFDKAFVEEFNSLPSLYAYRGYDSAVVFIKSLYSAMEEGLAGNHFKPLLTPYTFELDGESGIFVNNQWVKVNYNHNFTITTE